MRSKSTNLICPNAKCKEEINKPVLLTDLSKTPARSYYACPRCMTKLNVASKPQKAPEIIPVTTEEMPRKKKEEIPKVIEPQKTKETPARPPEPKTEEAPPGCPHYFGYLGKRPKDASIPDKCLTCRKMIDCTLR